MPLSSHSTSMPRCHQRARPMEWRIPGRPTWPGRLIESCFAVHSGSAGHRLLDPEPVPARGAVPRPVQPGVVGEDLQARADDEHHEEQVEEVLPSHPDRETRWPRACAGRDRARVAAMNRWTDGSPRSPFADRDRDDQQHEPDRQQPEQVEPPAATDPHPRGDAGRVRHRTRPRRRIDHVLAHGQRLAVAANHVRRNPGGGRYRNILGRLASHP